MTRLTLLCSAALALSALVSAAPVDPAERSSDPPIAVVGGDPVGNQDKYPWIVSLQQNNRHFCGGSLIAPNVVMTAGHCTSTWASPTSYKAVAHRYDLRKSSKDEAGIDFDVVKFYIHPNYTTSNGAPINDIALWSVKLKNNFSLQPPVVAGLAVESTVPANASNVLVIGWGTTREGGSVSPVLMEAAVPVIDNPTCAKLYSGYTGVIIDSVVCAGLFEGGKDTCQGDSGGPLFQVVDGKVVVGGITSWGDGCARKNKPGVYTRVGSHVNWIQETLSKISTTDLPEEVPTTPAN
ncbi:hypothetical protein HK102_011370 [Quaeritorhiza haematococci]|nr:hypothetical protein HK102_011370 [Quaeritorhiza haematococci]